MKAAEQRFREKIAPANGAGCQLWAAYVTSKGYGQFRYGSRALYAHRYAWELANGPIPAGLHVCHHCDMPACCTPEHLFLGAQAANMADMRAKGRAQRGSKHWNAKLTEAGAVEIFSAIGTCRAIGARHGISHTLVFDIKRRRRWAHVTANLTTTTQEM